MSIQSEITRISGNVSDALDAVAAKGVTVPSGANSDDLAGLIGQITGGGGASNVFTGSFTATSTVGASDTFVIPYTGTGYIVALSIWIDGGYVGNADWDALVQPRTIGIWFGNKSTANTVPSYVQDSDTSNMTVVFSYKGDTADSMSIYNTKTARAYWNSNAYYARTNVAKIRNATTVSYYTRNPDDANTSRYGFWAGAKYNYMAVYSS